MHTLIEKGYIPLDKSWIIRMGVLDLINNNDKTVKFLEKQNDLCDDLKALLGALKSWENNEINVGESGTLYRFLKFASWKLGLDKKFILRGTLKERKICDDPEIVNLSLEELLKLDNGTSQWASAAVLMGNDKLVDNPPYKLRLTYEAVEEWNSNWKPRYDKTILKQVAAFLNLLKGKREFVVEQAEDYCFGRIFGFVSKEEGESKFPSLRGHESDRLEEMEKQIENCNSKDHRVVQALAMYQKLNGVKSNFLYPSCVSKSWPQFWIFLKDSINV